ncbi:MAG: hypothetical protein BWY86_00197 [Candidatus Aminicenantes bacterium ADurb.Bin508]|nr:MAG: hypothetical protein BWY86_00197 [Candidatus Aminicenantes bacterium ADurb.Bin508]
MERERVAERRRAKEVRTPARRREKKRCFPRGRSQGAPKRSRRKREAERESVSSKNNKTPMRVSQWAASHSSLFRGLVKRRERLPRSL